MGKLDKERLGEAPVSQVTVELLAHVYNQPSNDHIKAVRINSGYAPRTVSSVSPMDIIRARDRQQAFPYQQDTYQARVDGQPQGRGSQKGQKPKYNNRSPHGRGR